MKLRNQRVKMDLNNDWFRPAAYYLVKVRKMKQKDVASMFGVYPTLQSSHWNEQLWKFSTIWTKRPSTEQLTIGRDVWTQLLPHKVVISNNLIVVMNIKEISLNYISIISKLSQLLWKNQELFNSKNLHKWKINKIFLSKKI